MDLPSSNKGCITSCKRRFTKLHAFIGICLAVIFLNLLMFTKTSSPLDKLASAFCFDHPSKLKTEVFIPGSHNVSLVPLLQELTKTNQSATNQMVLAVLTLLRPETDKTRFLKWVSSYLEEQSRVLEPTRNVVPKATKDSVYDISKYAINDRQMSRGDQKTEDKTLGDQKTENNTSDLVSCPVDPPILAGPLSATAETIAFDKLTAMFTSTTEKFPAMEKGGHYKPKDCKPGQKLAIIIPYRNRYSHLLILLYRLIPILQRQQSDFRIFVVEQNMPTTFNRAILHNVGYLEGLKVDNFDCFVFHDVDLLPMNDRCLYRCPDNPMHLSAAINKWNNGIPYHSYFGGVVMFSREQYKRINGNSNLYFGWGGEDDDLWSRVSNKGYKVTRYPNAIGRYNMIKHTRDSGNADNPDRMRLLSSRVSRQDIDGLSTCRYDVTSVEEKAIVTWIHVSIDMNKILESAPAVAKAALKALRH